PQASARLVFPSPSVTDPAAPALFTLSLHDALPIFELKPLSLIATLPFQVTIAGLLISPPRVTPTVPSAGSSDPYTLVWFATVAVIAAAVICTPDPAPSLVPL